MGKGKRTPLSVRERNGMIALLVLGLGICIFGWSVRRCNSVAEYHSGVIVVSDTDSIDVSGRYGGRTSTNSDDSSENQTSIKKKNKSKKNSRNKNDRSDQQNRKKSANRQATAPERKHLEEDLTERSISSE